MVPLLERKTVKKPAMRQVDKRQFDQKAASKQDRDTNEPANRQPEKSVEEKLAILDEWHKLAVRRKRPTTTNRGTLYRH